MKKANVIITILIIICLSFSTIGFAILNRVLEIERSINYKRIFMVTTSDDIVNEFNKNNYKYEEGITYLVRYPKNRKNFKYYYNSSTNEYLYPNDKIIVDMPTHLIAIYE